MLDISLIPAFKDNYIWLLKKGRLAAVVDPGDAAPVKARLAAEGLQLAAILITHHHADHQGGVADLLASWPVPVYAPAGESITGSTVPLSGGDRIEVLDTSFEVLDVPGHTAGHIAYYSPGCLFCGDTLFAGGCGRLFEGTPAQMQASLAALASLPEDTQVYCAHEYTEGNLAFALAVEPGNRALQTRVQQVASLRARSEPTVPSQLGEELATNPFLRWDSPEVMATARAHGATADDPVSVFTAIRAWKNVF